MIYWCKAAVKISMQHIQHEFNFITSPFESYPKKKQFEIRNGMLGVSWCQCNMWCCLSYIVMVNLTHCVWEWWCYTTQWTSDEVLQISKYGKWKFKALALQSFCKHWCISPELFWNTNFSATSLSRFCKCVA